MRLPSDEAAMKEALQKCTWRPAVTVVWPQDLAWLLWSQNMRLSRHIPLCFGVISIGHTALHIHSSCFVVLNSTDAECVKRRWNGKHSDNGDAGVPPQLHNGGHVQCEIPEPSWLQGAVSQETHVRRSCHLISQQCWTNLWWFRIALSESCSVMVSRHYRAWENSKNKNIHYCGVSFQKTALRKIKEAC